MFKALFDAFRFLATYLRVAVDFVSKRREIFLYLTQVRRRGLCSLRTPVCDNFDDGGHCGSFILENETIRVDKGRTAFA